MVVKAPLGPHQINWLKRIRAAGGTVEMDIHRNGHPTIWIPVSGGQSVRLPVRIFESLMQRDLFDLVTVEENRFKRWRLKDDEGLVESESAR